MISALQMFIGFGMPVGLILALAWLRSRERLRLLELIQVANAADKPLTPEMIRCLPGGFDRPTPERDRRRGIFLLCIGGGMLFIAIVVSGGLDALDQDWAGGAGAFMAGVAAIPACIGAAFLILGRQAARPD